MGGTTPALRISRTALVCVIVVAGAATVGPVVFYALWFRGWPLLEDTGAWASFGEFVSGTSGVLVGLGNLVLLACIALYLQQRQDQDQRAHEIELAKLQRTFDLYREWTVLLADRTRAGAFIRTTTDTMKAIDDGFHRMEAGDQAAVISLWTVLGFLVRLSHAVGKDAIKTEMVPEMFGDTFVWWRVVCDAKALKETGWPSWRAMETLDGWMEHHAQDEYPGWVKLARRDLERDERARAAALEAGAARSPRSDPDPVPPADS